MQGSNNKCKVRVVTKTLLDFYKKCFCVSVPPNSLLYWKKEWKNNCKSLKVDITNITSLLDFFLNMFSILMLVEVKLSGI